MLVRTVKIALALVVLSATITAQGSKITSWQQFAAAFEDGVTNNDYPTQQKLVKQHKDLASLAWNDWEARWCEASAKGEASVAVARKLDRVLEGLAFLNKTVHRTDYYVERRAWLQGLSQEAKQIKSRLWDRYNTIYEVWDNALKLPTEEKMRDVAELILPAAEAAETATDNYQAANLYHMLARCFEAIPEYFDAYYYCQKAVILGRQRFISRRFAQQKADIRASRLAKSGRIREELVRTDIPLAESKAAYKKALENPTAPEGGGGETEGGGGGGAGGGSGGSNGAGAEGLIPGPRPNDHGRANMDWVKAEKLKLKGVSKALKFVSPFFPQHSHWYFWPEIRLPDGGEANFTWVPGGATIKNDGGKMMIDLDGSKDGKKPTRFKFGAKPKMLRFKGASYRDGSKGDVYARAMFQPNQYKIVDFSYRLTGKGKIVRGLGASMVSGKLMGKDFALYDLDGNGTFSDVGRDCIVFGKGKKAIVRAMSKIVMIGDKLFELSVSPNGMEVRARPYDGPIAALKVEYESKMMPEWLLATGSGKDAGVFINLMDAVKEPMWVVPSAYQVTEGFIAKGKGDKAKTMIIRKGRSGIYNVQPGKMNTWALGGAGKKGFTFGFKASKEREKGQDYVVILGNDVKVYGNFGEIYQYSMFGRPLPMVQIRKGKDGPVWFKKEMKKPDRSDSDKSEELIWYPKTLKTKKNAGGDYSVRLEGDVPGLGHATSEWSLGN